MAVAASRPGCYGVLVILDGEGDPVCRLGPKLLARSLPAALGKTVVVALADPKYEAWLVASAETLGLPALSSESPRDPAAAIAQALSPRGYSKPTWQPRLTSKMDLARAASRSHSLHRTLEMFDRLCRSI